MAVAETHQPPPLVVVDGDQRGSALVAAGGDLNPHTSRAWDALLRRGDWDVVIDVGANYGEMLRRPSLPIGADVFAIEANPRLMDALSQNVRHLGERVTTVLGAAVDRTGDFLLVDDHDWSGTSRVVGSGEVEALTAAGADLVPVPSFTLDEAFCGKGYLRAAIKIDVEGDEWRVVEGARRFLGQLHRHGVLLEIMNMPADRLARLAEDWNVYAIDARAGSLVRIPAFSGPLPDAARRVVEAFSGLDGVLFMDAILVPPDTRLDPGWLA